MRKAIDPYLMGDLQRVAHLLADKARVTTLGHFRGAALAVEDKGGMDRFDPVTQADRATEMELRGILARERPDDGVLGEEFGSLSGTSGLTWVIDPIDGTRSYMCGTPTWGVLIAVSDKDGPVFGIIDQPYIGERFAGGAGVAEVVGPMGRAALRSRTPRPLSQAIVFTTFPEVGTAAESSAFHAVSKKAKLTRYGTDCYAYALIAAGQIDLVIEAGLQPYDVHAPIAVIEAAGGIVTDWNGGPAHDGGQILAAANVEIHGEALAILRNASDRKVI